MLLASPAQRGFLFTKMTPKYCSPKICTITQVDNGFVVTVQLPRERPLEDVTKYTRIAAGVDTLADIVREIFTESVQKEN